jgi:formate hydrogenlyase subunit 4
MNDASWLESAGLQLLHALLVVAVAPGLTGIVRLVKSRLTGKRGAPIWQPYRDLWRLLRKEAVVAETASWLFRVAPYLTFAAIWLGAALIPAFSTDLLLGPSVDLIVLVALLGGARFFTALAGLDVGTSFGGIGSSRELMIASLAEPAMLMVIFTVSLLVGTTSLAIIAAKLLGTSVGLRVSLGLGLVAIVMVAIAENARVPVDNPATHLELTMVHEAMILEYSGRHLALMEAAAMLKLLLYLSLIACIFAPFGMALPAAAASALGVGLLAWLAKMIVGAMLLGLFETAIAKMRVFRVSEFLAAALLLGLLATIFLYVSKGL